MTSGRLERWDLVDVDLVRRHELLPHGSGSVVGHGVADVALNNKML